MCKFFSCVSDGHGSIRYFSAKERTEINNFNPKDYKFDSHSSICHYFLINEDKWNKYEYNPFTKKFVVDTLNNTDDSAHVEKQVRNLDFTDIFETGLFGIDLSELESLDNVVLPEKCTYINLCRCTELNNVKFPKEIKGYLDLRSLKKSDNVVLPEKCTYINLCRCTELNNVKFPKEITEYLDLSSLKKLDNVVLPEKCTYINLNSIESKDFEMPEKHGVIYFKDKNVNSNL